MDDKDDKKENHVPMIEKDKYLRLAADLDNFRKQQATAMQEMNRYAGQKIIIEMLALADMVESAIEHAPEQVKAERSWFEGLEQITKRFADDMEKYGVKKIKTEGQTFDPMTMEAVQMVEGGESDKVQSEIRAGYRMHERVIRPARVVVFK